MKSKLAEWFIQVASVLMIGVILLLVLTVMSSPLLLLYGIFNADIETKRLAVMVLTPIIVYLGSFISMQLIIDHYQSKFKPYILLTMAAVPAIIVIVVTIKL